MRQHDALRVPGAATGEEDDVRIGLARRRFVDRLRSPVAPIGRPEHRDRDLRLGRGRDRAPGHRRRARVHHHEPGPRLGEDAGCLVGGETRVQRDEHRAEPGQRDEQRHHRQPGIAQPCDSVAQVHAVTAQAGGQPVGGPVELGERQGLVVERDCDAVRGRGRGSPKYFPHHQCHRLMVSPSRT